MFLKSKEKKLLEELKGLGERLAEDRIYEQVISEIDRNDLDAVAKAKAFEEAEGDDQKAKALYIKHRIRRIHDLAAAYEIWLQQEAKQTASLKSQEEERALHRKILSEHMKKGEMPPRDIQRHYKKEFYEFYSTWVDEDYARKFFPKASAWREFLIRRKLIE